MSPDSVQNACQSTQDDDKATSHITINEPSHVFNALCHKRTTQDFLRNMSQQNKPLYFVTGLQVSSSSNHKRAAVEQESIAEDATTPQPQLHPPFRRVDSASNVASPGESCLEEGSILAVQLRKVKCRIGAVDEPHCISDVDYVWSYHLLDDEDEDVQLSIGLGKMLDQHEWRDLAGITEKQEEGDADHNWAYDYEDSDDGLSGF